MNEYLSGFILGLCQGLTEFLPVSSSGHLVLLESMGVGEPDLMTNLLLHLATLIAVLCVYGKKIIYLIKHPLDERMRFLLLASAVTAVPAGIIRYFLPQNVEWLPLCFIATSVILVLPHIIKPKQSSFSDKWVAKAIFVGLAQGLACINGISRSGTTVTAMRLAGADDDESADMAFLLAIPIIIAGSGVEALTQTRSNPINGGIILGMVVAFIVGIIAIKSFVALLKKKKMYVFSVYTFILGIATFFIM